MPTDNDVELTAACGRGDAAAARNLLASGAQANQSGKDGPLISAAMNGHAECLRILLDAGADPDIRNAKGSTPLMCAAYYGHMDCVRALMERGADTGLSNNEGKTALRYAQEQNKSAIAARLMQTPEEVSFTYSLDNRVMQEIFNFPRRERVTLIRKSEGGDVEAMQRDSFAALDDVSGLRRAFEEHRKRGGRLEEGEVFPHTLAKLKPPRMEK